MTPGLTLPARLLQSPRVGFGLTVVALVGLASTGTGVLVAHGTKQLQPQVRQLVPPATAPSAAPLVVDRAPGTFLPPPVRTVRVVIPVVVREQAPEAVASPPPVVGVGPVVPTVPELPPVVLPPVVVPPPVVTPATDGKHKKPHPAHPSDRGKHLGQKKHA